jgi:hypothetical protein
MAQSRRPICANRVAKRREMDFGMGILCLVGNSWSQPFTWRCELASWAVDARRGWKKASAERRAVAWERGCPLSYSH